MIGTKVAHYRILEKLGEGGMGAVYLAEDSRLDRRVALKVLPEAMASDPDRLARFEREAKAVAALNHPNIITVHSIEQDAEIHFITMEAVEGKSLERLIPSDGFDLSTFFEVAIPLADALAVAHDRGITHRDIKPANVMVTDGDRLLKILDFGLAEFYSPPGEADPTGAVATLTAPAGLTLEGAIMGTVPYMSPEQVEGKHLDHRTDIFSLGVVLYEMLTGERPFRGESAAGLTSAILRDAPRPVTERRAELPRQLERIVSHCLQKDPKDRFQTARDVCNELKALEREVELGVPGPSSGEINTSGSVGPAAAGSKVVPARGGLWIGLGVVALAAAVGAGLWLGRGVDSNAERTDRPAPVEERGASIAVLPFVDESPTKDQEYFCDGLAEELLNTLARIPELKVAARTSSFSFKGKNKQVADIGRALGVSSILEGGVRKLGERVRITVRLVNAADGFQLWSDDYDGNLDDILEFQSEVARSVASKLQVELLGDRGEASEPRTSGEAYNLALQGRHFRDQRGEENLRKAASYYQQALELDPGYALAWARLADVQLAQAGQTQLPLDEGFRDARAAAMRALELDEELAEGWAALARIRSSYDWDWAGAHRALGRALELEPGNATVLMDAAWVVAEVGRVDEAAALVRRAVELDPLNPRTHSRLGFLLRRTGELDEALASFRKALELAPGLPTAHLNLGVAYLELGRPELALREMERESVPLWRRLGLAFAYHALDRKIEADQVLADFIDDYQEDGAYQVAQIYGFRDESDQAFEWLERAYAQRDPGLSGMKVDPMFKGLHADPRWLPFLDKMRLSG